MLSDIIVTPNSPNNYNSNRFDCFSLIYSILGSIPLHCINATNTLHCGKDVSNNVLHIHTKLPDSNEQNFPGPAARSLDENQTTMTTTARNGLWLWLCLWYFFVVVLIWWFHFAKKRQNKGATNETRSSHGKKGTPISAANHPPTSCSANRTMKSGKKSFIHSFHSVYCWKSIVLNL